MNVTVGARPVVSAHHLVTILVTGAVSVGLTIAVMPAFATSKTAAVPTKGTRADATLCQELAKATPGSPADFRLAETISDEGSC